MENDNFMFDIEKQFEIDNIDISKKMLLGVSGGPDSMFLLNLLKNKNIIVAHVNYNKRETSKVDEEIVVDFCKKNNIKYFVLNLKKHNEQGNFQNIARIQRYEFFKKIYDEFRDVFSENFGFNHAIDNFNAVNYTPPYFEMNKFIKKYYFRKEGFEEDKKANEIFEISNKNGVIHQIYQPINLKLRTAIIDYYYNKTKS